MLWDLQFFLRKDEPRQCQCHEKSPSLLQALLPAAANAVLLQVGSCTLNNWAEYGVNTSIGVCTGAGRWMI